MKYTETHFISQLSKIIGKIPDFGMFNIKMST